MNRRKKRIYSLITFLLITTAIFAQQVGSNSPYSRYGYGLLSHPAIGASEAMGGISYGLRRSQQVNSGNPASYSELDSLTLIFDLGVSGHYAYLKDGINSRDFYNGNFDYAAIQFPLFQNIGASIGLLPYSKTGYNYGGVRSLSNIQYLESYRGTGGLTRFYGGIAWEAVENLSVGVNFNYLFGKFNHSSVVSPVTTSALVTEKKNGYGLRGIMYDFGLQYRYDLDNLRSITLGAVYTPSLHAKADVNHSILQYNEDPYEQPWQSPVGEIANDTVRGSNFHLPHTFGLGITYGTNQLLLGVDGTYGMWAKMEYPDMLDGLNRDNRFNNLLRINTGVEYVKNPVSQRFLDRVRFRGGLSYSNSYANFFVVNPENGVATGTGSFRMYGFNVGLGLPFHDYRTGHVSMFNITFGYYKQQPSTKGLIAQDMFKISLNMNVNELWFFKRQFD